MSKLYCEWSYTVLSQEGKPMLGPQRQAGVRVCPRCSTQFASIVQYRLHSARCMPEDAGATRRDGRDGAAACAFARLGRQDGTGRPDRSVPGVALRRGAAGNIGGEG
jgi:hypothetical protein